MKKSIFGRFVPVLAGVTTLALSALAFSPSSFAQNTPVERANVRGSIVSFSGNLLQVKNREGKTLNVTLAEGWKLAGVTRASIADIKPGVFVGIASLPKADGGDGALEVLIFPAAMKGTGEGSFAWDLQPKSNMTNATVADAVKDVNGQTVTVTYHGKEKKITIPQGTPVVTFGPASKDDLKSGGIVFIPTTKDAKGALIANQVVVGTNGVVPPM